MSFLYRAARFKLRLISLSQVPYVYHISYLGRLDSIQSSGLEPGVSGNFSGYTGHSKGRVFFTEADGISFWHSKMSDLAHHNTDWKSEGDADWIPIVIRMPANKLGNAGRDQLGTSDARSNAYYMPNAAHPEWMSVWDGSEWVDLVDADSETMRAHILASSTYESDDEEEDEDEYGEEQSGWWEMDMDALLPED